MVSDITETLQKHCWNN